jgi:hypothetical protein
MGSWGPLDIHCGRHRRRIAGCTSSFPSPSQTFRQAW